MGIPRPPRLVKEKLTTFFGILPVVIVLDLISKSWALTALDGGHQIELLGGWIPLTLAFNRGAAFGLTLGSDPRLFFIPVTVVALILLVVLMVQAENTDWVRLISVSLVISGALGNLYDRIRWDRGVVDFIGPINLGVMDWPIFNVADMAISCGAVLLALSFWAEEKRARRAQAQSDEAVAAPEPSG